MRLTSPAGRIVLAAALGLAGTRLAAQAPLPAAASAPREPVHPARNIEEFATVEARWLRFEIDRTAGGAQPCLDELEVYGPDDASQNLALAANGARSRASGTLAGYRIHALPHVHDGIYGNGHSWISDTPNRGWVELEFPAPVRINRVVWSRDRERKFIDRLPVQYRIRTSLESGDWQEAASSVDREPLPDLPVGTPPHHVAPGYFAASATEMPTDSRLLSNEYLLETWQTSRGLPSNTVTAVHQTRDGWLWIGTTNGLARFDGVRFTQFGESHGLPSLSITCLLETNDGGLWAGTAGGGLAQWRQGKFEPHSLGSGLAANTVLSLAEDRAGALWVGTPAGLHHWSHGRLTRRVSAPAHSLAWASNGLWFIQNNSEMVRWDGQTVVRAPSSLDPSSFSSVTALAGDDDGGLWFGGANGYVGHMKEGAVTTHGEGERMLASGTQVILAVPGGDVWVGTAASGVVRLRSGVLQPITTDDGLAANSVRALGRDREGNIWVGTVGGGLTCLRPRRIEAVTTRDGLSHNGVMALAEDADGTLWIGTNGGGLNRLLADSSRAEPRSPSYVLENRVVSSLVAARDGALWIGTASDAAFRVENGTTTPVGLADGLPGRIVSAMCEDAEGGVWIGTLDGGPARFVAGRRAPGPDVTALAGLPVTSMVIDDGGRVWLGSAGQGVVRLDPGGTVRRWGRGDGMSSQFVRTLRMDSHGVLWAGTSGGLVRWMGERVFTYTQSHGLPDDTVSQILEDGDGNLWIGTNRGVARISQDSLERVARGTAAQLDRLVLGTADGLPSLECTGGYHPAGARRRDGRLAFGTVAGLALIDPNVFAAGDAPPPVILEAMAVGAEPAVSPVPDRFTTAASSSTRLGFRFTAPAFAAPTRLRFLCRLDGLDHGWIDPGPERQVNYASLAPGSYRFEVKASADGRAWSRPAAVSLRVPAPWWRTGWVVGGAAAASLALASGLARAATRRRMHRRIKAAEHQVALERERTRIARDIHDDLGANLTQIGLLSALGREQRTQPDAVAGKFAAIEALAGGLVQAFDAIVWAVNPRHDTLESLARYLVRYSGDVCAPLPVRLRLDVPAHLPDVVLGSEIRHSLFLAAKEALHNALRHADATEIRLSIAVEGGRLTLSLSDDGRGFDPAASGTAGHGGNGLSNMRQRLAECGGACEIDSVPGRGTRITFSLPLPHPP